MSLHIAGVAWGYEIFSKPKTLVQHYKQEAIVLMQWVFLMWASLYSSIHLQVFSPPSRRLANWTYFNWMIAYNLTLLLFFLVCYLLLCYCQYLKRSRSSLDNSTLFNDSGHKSTEKNASSAESFYKRKKHRASKVDAGADVEEPAPTVTTNVISSATMIQNVEFSVHVPVTFLAISSNGLVYFVLANLLTGLINLTLPTIHISGCPAVLIICVYMAVLNLVIVLLYRMNIKLI